jgi:hypothetical protein
MVGMKVCVKVLQRADCWVVTLVDETVVVMVARKVDRMAFEKVALKVVM